MFMLYTGISLLLNIESPVVVVLRCVRNVEYGYVLQHLIPYRTLQWLDGTSFPARRSYLPL